MDADCPLCRQVGGEGCPADEIVGEFPHSIAVLGPWQYYLGYCVLIARKHARELADLPCDERLAYFEEMCLLAEAISRVFQPRKLNYELLGNQVPHLHWHLFPRYESDPDKLKPAWLAVERAERDPNARVQLQSSVLPRRETVERLRTELGRLYNHHG
jgi:diadenosine tetraphosphate (Ap4A) HIT family hydrolase